MLLLDSNILIDYLRGSQKVKDFILINGKTNLSISTVVAMELYEGCRNKHDYATLKKELLGFVELDLNEKISKIALRLSQQYALSHQMTIPDTLIAATALVYDLKLITYNLKDFRFIPSIKVTNALLV